MLDQHQLRSLVGSWDVIGDMAITIIPEELREHESEIGQAILRSNARLKVVACRDGRYDGEFRTVQLRIIAGELRKETETRESGVRLRLNPERVYYSVRSGQERRRIAGQVKANERVLVPFSGIGPYPLVLARLADPALVIGVEKNPVAHDYAMTNLLLNRRLKSRVRLYCDDIRSFLARNTTMFDRIVMPLPRSGRKFLDFLLPRLETGGWIHYYSMERKGAFDRAVADVARAAEMADREIGDWTVHRAGHCAPRTYRICVDARVC